MMPRAEKITLAVSLAALLLAQGCGTVDEDTADTGEKLTAEESAPAEQTPPAGASAKKRAKIDPNLFQVTDKQNGTSKHLKPGNVLRITLDANATTGFEWTVKSVDESVIKLTDSGYIPPAKALPGAGGKAVLEFTAQSRGKTEIVLIYSRSWEKDVKPLKFYRLKILVK
jgi:inhibitor of cysteine peptidase